MSTAQIRSTEHRAGGRLRLGRRGAFWTSALVLALVLWSSGAPSVLYPLYAQRWTLTPAVVSAVFATYQIALVFVLPFFGNLADQVGRRLVGIWGVALIAASAVIFAFAPNVIFLFLGRALQGAGSALAMGAATASLVENNTSRNPRFASTMATIATSTGLTLALVISGVLARFAPMPELWSYVVLFVLTVAALIALALTANDRPAGRARWRPQRLRLPSGVRLSFAISTLSVALAYCVGALFLSLGSHMIVQFTHTQDTLVTGLLLGCSSVAIGITALFLTRIPAHASVWVGALLTVVGLAIMVAAADSGSISLFLGWCLVGGIGYAFAFAGGLGVINRSAPARHRGATLSLLYLVAYALQAATAIGVGALATAVDLRTGVSVAAITLTALCLVVISLAAIDFVVRRGASRPVTRIRRS